MTLKRYNDKIEITILGGGQEIGANSYLLKWGEATILLDAGQDPTSELADALVPLDQIPNNLDAIIISHGHFDHIGSLPFVYSNRKPKKIISQKFSREIISRMTVSSASYLEKFAQDSLEYAFSDSYSWDNIALLKTEMKKNVYNYNQEFKVSDKITGYFFDAGHILGSSGIVLTDGDYSFVYTGDIALKNHGVHNGAKLPDLKNINCILTESTTSSELKPVIEKEQWNTFFNSINDAYKRKSRILIPAFALGRSQDIISLIDYGMRIGRINKKIPVYLGGLGIAITEIYEKHKCECRDKLINTSFFDMYEQLSFRDLRRKYNDLYNKNETGIFVLTNGMMAEGTPSAVLGKIMTSDENETIIFSGYQSPATLGYEVLNAKIGDEVDFGEHYVDYGKIKSKYISQVRLSGHGSREDMNEIVNHFNPENIIVVHGDLTSIENLMNDLKSENRAVLGPKNGETIILRDSNNQLMKSKTNVKAQIITVGTSLIGNFKRENSNEIISVDRLTEFIINSNEDKRACCAEIQTLNNMEINSSDLLYFISSGDNDGILCGEALANAYNEMGFDSECISIKGLTKNYNEFQLKGLPNFIHSVVDIIENHGKNANIIATGGFKAETAYATMIGSFTKVPVFYIHEDFSHVIEMPSLPVSLDLTNWKLYFNIIDFILSQSNLKDAKKVIDTKLPEFMKILFTEDFDLKQMVLTPIGQLLKRLHAEYIISHNNILKLNAGKMENHLWGSGPIHIKDIPNYELRIILSRFQIFNYFMKEISIGKYISKSNSFVKIKFKYLENEKLIYEIITPNGGHELIIKTYAGVEKALVNQLGKNIQL